MYLLCKYSCITLEREVGSFLKIIKVTLAIRKSDLSYWKFEYVSCNILLNTRKMFANTFSCSLSDLTNFSQLLLCNVAKSNKSLAVDVALSFFEKKKVANLCLPPMIWSARPQNRFPTKIDLVVWKISGLIVVLALLPKRFDDAMMNLQRWDIDYSVQRKNWHLQEKRKKRKKKRSGWK